MEIRLGYVAIALNLPKVTTSSTVTYTNYQKLATEEEKLRKLKTVTLSNFNDLIKILRYNVQKNIHFYRMTSAFIPLATHKEVLWDYKRYFSYEFEKVGNIIKDNKMRVDMHPDQFNVLNSTKEDVIENSIINLSHQADWFEMMNYDQGKLVLHVNSSEGGKEEALKRFEENVKKIPEKISKLLILENDDKTYTALETLNLCKNLNMPFVLDVHHHNCNNNGENLSEIIDMSLKTWEDEFLPAKFHFSSPKNSEFDKKHSDYINAEEFIKFIEKTQEFNKDLDVMLEAKNKDQALLKLVDDIRSLKPEWRWKDRSTLILNE